MAYVIGHEVKYLLKASKSFFLESSLLVQVQEQITKFSLFLHFHKQGISGMLPYGMFLLSIIEFMTLHPTLKQRFLFGSLFVLDPGVSPA